MKLVVTTLATLMLAGAGLSAAPAAAAPAQTCPLVRGFVCLAPRSGPLELIPEGERRAYPAGLPVTGMSNGTRISYCVVATPVNFVLPAGSVSSRPSTVRTVAPNPGACIL